MVSLNSCIILSFREIHSFDLDKRRLATMKEQIAKSNAKCVRARHQDFLKVNVFLEFVAIVKLFFQKKRKISKSIFMKVKLKNIHYLQCITFRRFRIFFKRTAKLIFEKPILLTFSWRLENTIIYQLFFMIFFLFSP